MGISALLPLPSIFSQILPSGHQVINFKCKNILLLWLNDKGKKAEQLFTRKCLFYKAMGFVRKPSVLNISMKIEQNPSGRWRPSVCFKSSNVFPRSWWIMTLMCLLLFISQIFSKIMTLQDILNLLLSWSVFKFCLFIPVLKLPIESLNCGAQIHIGNSITAMELHPP